jgi:hypothetical protein
VVLAPTAVSAAALAWARFRDRSPAETLSRAMAIAALLLAVVYAPLLVVTAGQEQTMKEGLERTLKGEGRYLAELQGKAWPPQVW